MTSKEKYKELLSKAYRNMDMTPDQLAEIAMNPIDTVQNVLMKKDDGILKYAILWENSASKSIGNVKMN